MELRHLRYFVTVAELLNFTKAASRLHVAQPALSRQIRDLEEELGMQLLERGPRAVRLTDAGVTFLNEAKAVLQRADEAVKAVRAVARGERGEIQVGYAPSPTVELLPCTLHTFQNLAPEVRVTLHDLSSEEMLRGLSEGRLNVCLMVEPASASVNGLKFEVLREYPACVAMRLDHPLAGAKWVSLEQISDEPLVAYARAGYPEYHAMLETLFRASDQKLPTAGVTKLKSTGRTSTTTSGARITKGPRITDEHDSAPGLIAAVEIGRGLAIVPSCMALLTGGRLKLLPLRPAPPPLRVGTAFFLRRLSPATEKFLQAARTEGRAGQSKLGRE